LCKLAPFFLPHPQVFKEIAAASGQNSQERKKGYVVKLLAASKGNEAGYIMRSLQVRMCVKFVCVPVCML